MIKFNDLSRDFFDFWEEARGKSQEEQLKLWQERYEAKHPEVFQVYFSLPYFGRREKLRNAFSRYAEDFSSIIERVKVADDLIPQTIPRALAAFDINEEEVDLDLVLMVGVYMAAGFSWPLNSKVGVFFALEHMPHKRESALIFIAHELSHAIHFALGLRAHSQLSAAFMEEPLSLLTRLDVRLFAEGLATSASKRIIPGLDERAYHLPGSAEQWAWCQANRELLVEMTLRGLQGDQRYAYSELFSFPVGEDPKELSFPETGYYVGYLAIEQLLKRHSLRELAQMDPEEFPELICRALANDFGRD